MKLARYIGNGKVAIVEEPAPECPEGGLLVKTMASGLCSGELMSWYMDSKIPHVLGHEVCGRVVESQDSNFPVGSLVVPHHHAPCGKCDLCLAGHFVHCPTWKKTKLIPGGMAEYFAVPKENFTDTHIVDGLDPRSAALTEPTACVAKAIRRSGWSGEPAAVIGLGAMGLIHCLALGINASGFDLNDARVDNAAKLGIKALSASPDSQFDFVFVCPGSPAAINSGIQMAKPTGKVILFAPLGPNPFGQIELDLAYFKDLSLITSYSAGPGDMIQALQWIEEGLIKWSDVVSDLIAIDDLPDAYSKMKMGEIVKPMVVFDD